MPAAVPIKMYSTVQTGAKTQLGGLKLGLFNRTYQSFTELCVAKLERRPIKRQIPTQMAILR